MFSKSELKKRMLFLMASLALMIPTPAFSDQFLHDIRPTGTQLVFGLHGDYQIFLRGIDSAKNFNTRIFHTLTLEPDIRLTSDFRIHARWRPIKNEILFDSDIDADRFGAKAFKTESLERAFFEARISRVDTAGGLVPLEFHNLYMAQDDVGGLLIAKNNISSGSISNMRIMGFGTVNGEGSRLLGREGRNVALFGVDAIADTQRYIIEGTLGFLSDNDAPKRGDEGHIGLSIIRIRPGRSNSLRVFGNSNREINQSGGLIVMEQSILYPSVRWDRPTWYINGFFGSENYQSMASGSLKNIGFLFDQTVGTPQLNNTGINSVGFATGFLMGASRDFSIISEVAAVLDQSNKNNDQISGGVRLQMRLFDTSFLRWDTVFLQQSKASNSAATTVQAVYKF
jgi:hypothetical protein